MAEAASTPPAPRAVCLIPLCKGLRVDAGVKIRELATLAEVSSDTVRNIERGTPVSEVYASRVLNALRTKTGKALPADEYIVRVSG